MEGRCVSAVPCNAHFLGMFSMGKDGLMNKVCRSQLPRFLVQSSLMFD